MNGPDFQTLAALLVKETKLLHTDTDSNGKIVGKHQPYPKEAFRAELEDVLSQAVNFGWGLGAKSPQSVIDDSVAEFDAYFNPPAPAPTPKTPFVYDYVDGISHMPTAESLAGKSVGDTIPYEGATYKLVDYPAGIAGITMPRWVKQ